MARIAVFNAASGLGAEIVSAGLDHGLEIHAIVRDTRKATRTHEAVNTFRADLLSGNGIDAAISGCSVLFAELSSPFVPQAEGLMQVAQMLVDQKRFGRKMVFVTAIPSVVGQRVARSLGGMLGSKIRSRGIAETILRDCPLQSVLVRPAALKDRTPRGPLVVAGMGAPRPKPLSRAALADFLIELLDRDVWGRELVVGGATTRLVGQESIDWHLPTSFFFRHQSAQQTVATFTPTPRPIARIGGRFSIAPQAPREQAGTTTAVAPPSPSSPQEDPFAEHSGPVTKKPTR